MSTSNDHHACTEKCGKGTSPCNTFIGWAPVTEIRNVTRDMHICLCYAFMVQNWIQWHITQHGSNPWQRAKWNSGFGMTTLILILN
jgi:hypothetical protein